VCLTVLYSVLICEFLDKSKLNEPILSGLDCLHRTADNAQGPEPFKSSSAYDCLLSIGNGDQ